MLYIVEIFQVLQKDYPSGHGLLSDFDDSNSSFNLTINIPNILLHNNKYNGKKLYFKTSTKPSK